MNDNNLQGWYYINEKWELYVNNELTEVHVDYINVDECPNKEGYKVKHFDRMGDIITTLTLDSKDLEMLKGKQKAVRPWHI